MTIHKFGNILKSLKNFLDHFLKSNIKKHYTFSPFKFARNL